jgi:uncharacterized protein
MAIPIPRDLTIDLSAVPRHWFAGSTVATAISNGINLLFPDGERFFVRSVHHYVDQLDDDVLRAQVKAFFKQEGHHAHAHDQLNDVLRGHGFELDAFLARYRAISGWIERRAPPKLNLAATAAAEHFTATLAEGSFRRGVLDALHPQMQELLAWHAAEEIEQSYALRVAGLVYATAMLGGFWAWATVMLLRQERLGWRGIRRQLRDAQRQDPVVRRVFTDGIRQYLRRDFHPRDNANDHHARDWFAAHGLPFTEAA